MITLVDVTVAYPGRTPVQGLDLELPAGSTALMGPSGSGKSSLLRLMAGLQRPSRGTVRIDGTSVAVGSWRSTPDGRAALVHQDYRLVPFLDVAENLQLAAELRGRACGGSDVAAVLEAVGLDPGLARRLPGSMSGGEQQRVSIARGLVCGARYLLADEPTGALDADSTAVVAELLASLGRRDDLTVVVATHDPGVADRLDRTVRLVPEPPVPAA